MVLRVTDAVPRFMEYMTGRGLSAGTLRRHGYAAGRFAAACQEVKGPKATMGQVDHECIARHFGSLTGGQGSRNNALESVKALLNWAEKWGYLRPGFTAAQLLDGYKCKKAERAPKYYLSAEEFPAALEAAGRRSPRNRAVVAIALFTLARQSEIAGLRLCDLDLDKMEIRIYREKLKRWTTTGMTPELVAEMKAWLTFYATEKGYFSPHTMVREHPDWLLVPAMTKGYLFLQPEVPIRQMERIAKRLLTDLGVQGTRQGSAVDHLGEGMHTLRRSGARAFLKHLSRDLGHQRALIQVSLMLDHDDLKMTIRYIGIDQEREELNDWLKGNDMYVTPPEPPGASVTPLRRRYA